jgi:hypothetical protein
MGHAFVSWMVWARKWFVGPKVHGDNAQLEPIDENRFSERLTAGELEVISNAFDSGAVLMRSKT